MILSSVSYCAPPASKSGRRTVKARDFFKGLYETERADDELLIEARILERVAYCVEFELNDPRSSFITV